MKKFLRGCLCIPLIVSCLFSYSQGDNKEPSTSPAPKIIPPSPEASNLGKFAEVPVSLYTGVPEIRVPLYQVVKGPLNLDLSLSYHASGIKVEEMASWVGIGWALNSGGVVTRTVRGKPDDNSGSFGDGFLTYSKNRTIGTILADPEYQRIEQLADITSGVVDAEPDQYFVNVNNISIQFTFDWDGKIVQTEQNNIKVEPIQDANSTSPTKILGWIITDEKGTVYKFTDIETTNTDKIGDVGPKRNGSFASSWYLSQITDANNENSIFLTYDIYKLDYGFKSSVSFSHALQTQEFNCLGYAGSISESINRTQVVGKRIKEIHTDDNSIKVNFLPGPDRKDTQQLWLAGTTSNFKELSRIEIIDGTSGEDKEIKTYKLSTDYTTGRLTLKSITPQKAGRNISPPYQMKYNSVSLPTPLSKAQDHWGFYNGHDENTYLVPAEWIKTIDNGWIHAAGGNRSPDPKYTAAGSLIRLTYPTGGFDEFDFENHQYGYVQNAALLYHPIKPLEVDLSISEKEVVGHFLTKSANFTLVANPDTPNDPTIPVTISYSVFTDAATSTFKPLIRIIDLDNNKDIMFQRFGMQIPNVVQSPLPELRRLFPGNYRLEITCSRFEDPDDFVIINVACDQVDLSTTLESKIAGGLRIKEIRQFASASDANHTTRKFNYVMGEDPSRASGVIYQEPIYGYFTTTYCTLSASNPQGQQIFIYTGNPTYIRLSNNATMLGSTQGSHIGYREVETIYGSVSLSNGKSIVKYFSPYEYTDDIFFQLPIRPAQSRSYKTGLVKEQTDYRYEAGGYSPVRKTENEYTFLEPSVQGLAVQFLGSSSVARYIWGTYFNLYGKSKVSKTIATTYSSDNLRTQSITTDYSYDSYLSRLKKEIVDIGKDTRMQTEYWYASDFSNSPPEFITKMNKLNVTGAPVQIYRRKIVNNTVQGNALAGQFNEYEYNNQTGKLRLLNQKKLKITTTPTVSPNLTDSNFETEVKFEKHDSRGNILQFSTLSGITNSYIWDYSQSEPIAEIIGAKITDVAYTSFEADGKGQWDFSGIVNVSRAVTGKKSFDLTNASKSGLSSDLTYIVSYWSSGGKLSINGSKNATERETIIVATANGNVTWTYFEQLVSGSTEITISGGTAGTTIDELRLYPSDAQMKTFTYDPMIGETSATDANGRSTHYEYDLNRLKLIRDTEHNITRRYEYQYKSN